MINSIKVPDNVKTSKNSNEIEKFFPIILNLFEPDNSFAQLGSPDKESSESDTSFNTEEEEKEKKINSILKKLNDLTPIMLDYYRSLPLDECLAKVKRHQERQEKRKAKKLEKVAEKKGKYKK